MQESSQLEKVNHADVSRTQMSPFNAQGDLPSGVHRATLAEVLECFGHGAPQRVIMHIVGATVFWMNSGVGTEPTVASFLEQFQIRRDGGRRGIVEVVL